LPKGGNIYNFHLSLIISPRNDIQNRRVNPFEYRDLDIVAYLLLGAWCLGFGEGQGGDRVHIMPAVANKLTL
jgi:hypothetical protein